MPPPRRDPPEGGPEIDRRLFLGGSLQLLALLVAPSRAAAEPALESWLGGPATPLAPVPPPPTPFVPPGALARLGSLTLQHGGSVTGLVFSPDSQALVSTGSDRLVCFWDAATGLGRASWSVAPHDPSHLAFAPDGEHLLFAAEGLRIFAAGHSEGASEKRRWISALAVAPRRDLLALGVPFVAPYAENAPSQPNTGFVEVYASRSPTALGRFEAHPTPARALAFSPDESRLASVDDRGLVRLWGVPSFELVHELPSKGGVEALAFSPDGRFLALRHGSRTIELVDFAASPPATRVQELPGLSGELAFRAGSGELAVATAAGILLLDPASGAERSRIRFEGPPPRRLALAPDGSRLAFETAGRIRVFDLATRTEVASGEGLGGAISALAVGGGGAWMAAAGQDRVVRVFDTRARTQIRAFAPDPDAVTHLELVASGGGLASPAAGAQVAVRTVAAGSTSLYASQGLQSPWAFAASADGRWLAWGIHGSDHRIVVAPAPGETGQVRELKNEDEPWRRYCQVAFSPDGGLLAALVEQDEVLIYDLVAGRWLAPLRDPDEYHQQWSVQRCLEFIPGARSLLAWGRDNHWSSDGRHFGRVLLFDAASGKRQAVIEVGNRATVLAASPDGRWLAVADGGEDGVEVLALPSGALVAKLCGHRGGVKDMAFAPDGAVLYTASADATVILWDATRFRADPGSSALRRPRPEQTLKATVGPPRRGR